ncbi:MAG TPA: hypothetical protein PKU77_07515 [Ferruginibacter sp.]|nr:hypothetical protein [Ferruginibacter sp.]
MMKKYVVEAYDTRKGYRATISIPLSKIKAQKLAKELKYQNSIAATKFYNKLTSIKIKPITMATKKKKKAAGKRKKSAISSCASTLGRRGGKKTYSLGHGIFASITIKKKKKSAAKKKRAAKKRKK